MSNVIFQHECDIILKNMAMILQNDNQVIFMIIYYLTNLYHCGIFSCSWNVLAIASHIGLMCMNFVLNIDGEWLCYHQNTYMDDHSINSNSTEQGHLKNEELQFHFSSILTGNLPCGISNNMHRWLTFHLAYCISLQSCNSCLDLLMRLIMISLNFSW